jgi:hypothetical protein
MTWQVVALLKGIIVVKAPGEAEADAGATAEAAAKDDDPRSEEEKAAAAAEELKMLLERKRQEESSDPRHMQTPCGGGGGALLSSGRGLPLWWCWWCWCWCWCWCPPVIWPWTATLLSLPLRQTSRRSLGVVSPHGTPPSIPPTGPHPRRGVGPRVVSSRARCRCAR